MDKMLAGILAVLPAPQNDYEKSLYLRGYITALAEACTAAREWGLDTVENMLARNLNDLAELTGVAYTLEIDSAE